MIKTIFYEIKGQIPQNPIAYENGLKYALNFSNQNIGIFPDMKNGRSFIKEISKDKNVLNLFSIYLRFFSKCN
ncbi:MAG: class I SAM-dependent methyltransferase [Aliarcobacter sp.]|nr:class I SAM-dependent methyltransferase [Aliarcobacter sp.]